VTRRPPPYLVVEVALEADVALVRLHASSLDDEVRLRLWLRRSELVKRLPVLIAQALDELDRLDDGRAA